MSFHEKINFFVAAYCTHAAACVLLLMCAAAVWLTYG